MESNFDIRQKIENDETSVTILKQLTREQFCIQIDFYKILIHAAKIRHRLFIQRANIFSSNEMTHEKCFTTMVPLDASRDVAC